MTKSIMVQGATSGAGKTVLTALLCLHFARKGLRVAPFKAQNLSLNSYVSADGGELGISQAFQAWACGREPDWRMNPILLKPRAEGSCQVILSGRPYMDLRSGARMDRRTALSAVESAYRELSADADIVVIEGSGSPAEINLRSEDVANMATAELARSPVILVGDIDRGGVFAGLYGTYRLVPDRHRSMIKAFLINRFRGDPSILTSGIERLESLMSMPCLGVLPYLNVRFPAEDSLDLHQVRGQLAAAEDVKKAWLCNLASLLDVSERLLDYRRLEEILDSGV